MGKERQSCSQPDLKLKLHAEDKKNYCIKWVSPNAPLTENHHHHLGTPLPFLLFENVQGWQSLKIW
jgi:hypothetical protein